VPLTEIATIDQRYAVSNRASKGTSVRSPWYTGLVSQPRASAAVCNLAETLSTASITLSDIERFDQSRVCGCHLQTMCPNQYATTLCWNTLGFPCTAALLQALLAAAKSPLLLNTKSCSQFIQVPMLLKFCCTALMDRPMSRHLPGMLLTLPDLQHQA
jgi:hypothetical protein